MGIGVIRIPILVDSRSHVLFNSCPIPMGLPWHSHSHWDSQSHAHLYHKHQTIPKVLPYTPEQCTPHFWQCLPSPDLSHNRHIRILDLCLGSIHADGKVRRSATLEVLGIRRQIDAVRISQHQFQLPHRVVRLNVHAHDTTVVDDANPHFREHQHSRALSHTLSTG